MRKTFILILFFALSSYAYADTLVLLPNNIGTYNQLEPEPVTGFDHYLMVDEYPTADNLTTYLSNESAVILTDTFQYQDSSYLGVITNVTLTQKWLAYSAGGTGAAAIITHGTLYLSTYTTLSGFPTWTTTSKSWANNPYTGTAWTWAEINALEAGIKFGGKVGNFVTQQYMTVTYTPGPDPEASSANAIFYGTDF